MNPGRQTDHGYTFVELILVIAIMLIIFVGVLVNFTSYQRRTVLNTSIDQLTEYLHDAQNRSVNAEANSAWGVHLTASSYTIFSGTYSAGANTNIVDTLDGSITVTWSIAPGGGANVMFAKLTGTGTTDGATAITAATVTVAQGTSSTVVTICTSGNITLGSC